MIALLIVWNSIHNHKTGKILQLSLDCPNALKGHISQDRVTWTATSVNSCLNSWSSVHVCRYLLKGKVSSSFSWNQNSGYCCSDWPFAISVNYFFVFSLLLWCLYEEFFSAACVIDIGGPLSKTAPIIAHRVEAWLQCLSDTAMTFKSSFNSLFKTPFMAEHVAMCLSMNLVDYHRWK